ncbi:MAG: hypothetical protein NUV52_00865 [Candidatus Roizmanbacteria bacterium]|nr:hypothetical protein [Candidatus Roizmanbacteria bacterium]
MQRSHGVLTVLLITSFLMASSIPLPPKAQPSQSVLSEKTVNASASIGTLQAYSLFGYTSSYASVRLEGVKLYQETQARGNDGYFEFTNFLAPSDIKEFCLTSIDTEGMSSPSVCVPVPSQRTGAMGPYLLPPSIRLSTGNTNIDTAVTVSGKTIPNTSVTLEIFQANPTSLSLIKSANAQKRNPLLTRSAKSTSDGTYTYRYQNSQEAHVRIFSRSYYQGISTPKSNTLSLDIIGFITALLIALFNFFSQLLNPTTLLLLEAAIVGYLLYRRFFIYHHIKTTKALLKIERELMVYPSRPLLTFRNFTPIATQIEP